MPVLLHHFVKILQKRRSKKSKYNSVLEGDFSSILYPRRKTSPKLAGSIIDKRLKIGSESGCFCVWKLCVFACVECVVMDGVRS
jgi:hypothetical protein